MVYITASLKWTRTHSGRCCRQANAQTPHRQPPPAVHFFIPVRNLALAGEGQKDQATFKPRKVPKKPAANALYRDRAKERKEGVNDFADVEALLEDFEKRGVDGSEDKESLEEQRKYLGGDARYTVLVKGLDYALLEQNKNKEASGGKELDDALEEAYLASTSASATQASSQNSVPKKRTRDDILKDLKDKRPPVHDDAAADLPPEDKPIDKLKAVGKFKPIGAPARESKPKAKEVEKKRKKKRKVDASDQETIAALHKDAPRKSSSAISSTAKGLARATAAAAQLPSTVKADPSTVAPETPPPAEKEAAIPPPTHPAVEAPSFMETEEDVDIFADVGEYEAIDLGSDEDEAGDSNMLPSTGKKDVQVEDVEVSMGRVNWFNEPEPEEKLPSPIPTPQPPEAQEESDPSSSRLVPLASSAMASIRDVLAADKQLEAVEKRRARKEKMKKQEGKAA